MVENSQPLLDAAQIRQFVLETLCERERLAVDAYPLRERVLLKMREPCGVHYSLHGPRSMCLSAIWDAKAGVLLFYGSRGERFQKTRVEAPDPVLIPIVGRHAA